MGFQQVPVQGRYVLLRPPIHQKDPEPGDLLPVGFLRGEGRKQVNPNSYPTPQAHNLGGGPGTWAYTDTTLWFSRPPAQRNHPPLGLPGMGRGWYVLALRAASLSLPPILILWGEVSIEG